MSTESGGQTVARPPPRERLVSPDGWLLRVFGAPRRIGLPVEESVPVVAAALSLGLLVGGGLATVVLHAVLSPERALIYHRTPVFYTFSLWTFTLLLLVGHWSKGYVDLWTAVRPAFDVTDERFAETVGQGLSYAYRLDIPFLLFVPGHLVLQVVSPISIGAWAPLPEAIVFEGFRAVVNFLNAVVLYLVLVHTLLVRRVASLPFANVYSAPAELEPLAESGVSMAGKYLLSLAVLFFAWFVVLDVDRLRFTGGTEFVADLGLSGLELAFLLAVPFSYVVVGLLVFLVPMYLIHRGIQEARREQLVRIEREYSELFERFLDRTDADAMPDRVAELDHIRERTRAIRSWPFRLPSVLKLLASTIPPFVVYAVDLARDVWL